MSALPRPSTEMITIEDKHYTKQGWEINLISAGVRDIGPLLHICANSDQLVLPEDLPKVLKELGLPLDFVTKKKIQAENYMAEGAAMTPNGYNERKLLLEGAKDALKLNVTIAQKGRGGIEPDSSEPEKR